MDAIIALIGLGLLLAGFIAYIKALADAARTGKWIWFVVMLLMWPTFVLYVMLDYGAEE